MGFHKKKRGRKKFNTNVRRCHAEWWRIDHMVYDHNRYYNSKIKYDVDNDEDCKKLYDAGEYTNMYLVEYSSFFREWPSISGLIKINKQDLSEVRMSAFNDLQKNIIRKKTIDKFMSNPDKKKNEIVNEVANEMNVTPKSVSQAINSSDFKAMVNQIIGADEIIKGFASDFRAKEMDREKLFEIYTKWMGFDKQQVEVTFNKTPELDAMERILQGDSVIAMEEVDGVYEAANDEEGEK